MRAKLKRKGQAVAVYAAIAILGAGGFMFAFGWSPRITAIGAAILGLGAVCLVALAAYAAIANFGPLSLVSKEPQDHGAKNDS